MRWVTQADFGRHVGKTRQAISLACKPGGKLFRAFEKGKIDCDHEDAIAYLVDLKIYDKPGESGGQEQLRAEREATKKRGRGRPRKDEQRPQPPPPPPPRAAKPKKPEPPPEPEAPTALETLHEKVSAKKSIDLAELADWTLNDLCTEFGQDYQFKDWLTCRKMLADIAAKEINNEEARGKLITRDLVERGVIDVFNTAHLRLLKDGAKSLAVGVAAEIAAGANEHELEVFISDTIGSFISPVKQKIVRNLRR